MRTKSYDSVTVFWLDRKAALDAARRSARDLIRSDSNISKVVLFGSLANGNATARSDADILIVLHSTDTHLLDRSGHFTDAFRSIGLPVELFVYTTDEITRGFSSVAEHALASGMELR